MNQAILLNLAINDTTSDQLKLQASILYTTKRYQNRQSNPVDFCCYACSAY